MPDFRIITDSCCDLTMAQYHRLDAACAPLSVTLNGEVHDNFSEPEQLKEFYARLRNGEFAGTSAVNPEGWIRIMKPVLDENKDILCIAFSSGLSTTYQSAVIAADELREKYPSRTIRVIDSLCATMGQALLLHHACRLRDKGASLEEIARWCEENKRHVCHWIAVDGLEHLKRGGRISPSTAFVGGMLRIKPVFTINNEGKLSAPLKARGWKGAMDMIIQNFRELSPGHDNDTVLIAHGDSPEKAEALAAVFKEQPGVKNVIISYVGGVIGAHLGPGTISAFYVGSHR